jgi:hypothetical protein
MAGSDADGGRGRRGQAEALAQSGQVRQLAGGELVSSATASSASQDGHGRV